METTDGTAKDFYKETSTSWTPQRPNYDQIQAAMMSQATSHPPWRISTAGMPNSSQSSVIYNNLVPSNLLRQLLKQPAKQYPRSQCLALKRIPGAGAAMATEVASFHAICGALVIPVVAVLVQLLPPCSTPASPSGFTSALLMRTRQHVWLRCPLGGNFVAPAYVIIGLNPPSYTTLACY